MTSKVTNIQVAAKGTERLRLTKTAPNSNYDDCLGGSRLSGGSRVATKRHVAKSVRTTREGAERVVGRRVARTTPSEL